MRNSVAKVLNGKALGQSVGGAAAIYNEGSPPKYQLVDMNYLNYLSSMGQKRLPGIGSYLKTANGIPKTLVTTCAKAIKNQLKLAHRINRIRK